MDIPMNQIHFGLCSMKKSMQNYKRLAISIHKIVPAKFASQHCIQRSRNLQSFSRVQRYHTVYQNFVMCKLLPPCHFSCVINSQCIYVRIHVGLNTMISIPFIFASANLSPCHKTMEENPIYLPEPGVLDVRTSRKALVFDETIEQWIRSGSRTVLLERALSLALGIYPT